MLAKPLAFLLSITLLASLGFAQSAVAEDALGADPSAAFFEDEECDPGEPGCVEELGFEECEESEDGEEVECEEEREERRAGEIPDECLLIGAKPRVSVAAGQRRLRLDVRYDIAAPAEVSVSLRSTGGKGAVTVPAKGQRLSRDGSFHETLELSEEQTERALAARQFTVRLRVAGVPGSCNRYGSHQLTVKRGGDENPVFSEAGADPRASR